MIKDDMYYKINIKFVIIQVTAWSISTIQLHSTVCSLVVQNYQLDIFYFSVLNGVFTGSAKNMELVDFFAPYNDISQYV